MAQIYGKYYRSDTDEFPSVPWTLGWIQMRYEGEPMAQIKWTYHGHDTDEFPYSSMDFWLDPDEVWGWTHGSN